MLECTLRAPSSLDLYENFFQPFQIPDEFQHLLRYFVDPIPISELPASVSTILKMLLLQIQNKYINVFLVDVLQNIYMHITHT